MQSIIKSKQHITYTGFLNSNYKSIVNENFKSLKNNSIFSLKQGLKREQFKNCCFVETGLKLVLFFTGIIIAFN
ncbi:hypothetical protein [Lacinutrix sp.]|uniref:hypothetical protein n=1 Tax=Lacinutrix sp. TaxID=1937692 RepID=UPI0030EE64FB